MALSDTEHRFSKEFAPLTHNGRFYDCTVAGPATAGRSSVPFHHTTAKKSRRLPRPNTRDKRDKNEKRRVREKCEGKKSDQTRKKGKEKMGYGSSKLLALHT